MCSRLLKWWLTGLLLIMPFHFNIYKIMLSWNDQLAGIFNRIDEITVFTLFLPAIVIIYKKRDINFHLYLSLSISIFAVILTGFISGALNQNSLLITVLGIFHYIKLLLFIFIYAAFIRDYNAFKKIFRLLLIIAVFIGVIAIAEECWWLYSKYIMNIKNFRGRLGLYRATSLMSQFNIMGLYCLLILTVYTCMTRKINMFYIFSLVGGIFTSLSRTAYAGLAVLLGVQIIKGRIWLISLAIPIVIGLYFMSSLDDLHLIEMVNKENTEYAAGEKVNAVSFRKYALLKALDVWQDYPLIGAGPGMFGGAVAYKFRSPLYEEYNFHIIYHKMRSLDQLWPQVLAEVGIVGTAALVGLYISLFAVNFISRGHVTSKEMNGLFTGLSLYTIILFLYSFSANLNIISVLYPYCAFVGMSLGSTKS